jgi:tripartite ATP-independent transporter DctM subunit
MGFPIATGMLVIGFVGYGVLTKFSASLILMPTDLFTSITSYSLSVIGLFAWMGFLALHSGIGAGLYDFCYALIGHKPGGLAIASEGACAVFGAICGSGPATCATIGSIAFPQMKKYGYDASLYTGCVAAGGGLGLLIPPSITAIVYGVATQQSIGRLFMGGIGAGILMMVLYSLTILLIAKRNPKKAPRGEKHSAKQIFATMQNGILETLIIFIVSIGGLMAGIFTPSEGAAVGAFAMLAMVLIRRKLTWKSFMGSLLDTVKTVGMILFIFASAQVFGRFIALSQIPTALVSMLDKFNGPNFIIMTLVILIYLVAGMLIDSLALITLTVPIFYPLVVQTMGYDAIWFGVVVTLLSNMGMITPPVGMGAFIARNVSDGVPIETVFKGIWPFLYADIIGILLVMIIPQIITFLPGLLYG